MDLDVRAGSRSAITLTVLAVLFVAALAFGWSRVTAPFPERTAAAPCTDTLVRAGDELVPAQVMVTVLNSGGRNGLAGAAMTRLATAGFVEGRLGNAPTITGRISAQIWASDPGDPAAILLASYLGKDVDVVDQPSGYPGITIVLGRDFKGIRKGRASVTAQKDAYVCMPPGSTVPDAAGTGPTSSS